MERQACLFPIDAGLDGFWSRGLVDEVHIAEKRAAGFKVEGSAYGDLVGIDERWEPQGVEGVHELVELAVEIDNGSHAIAGRVKGDLARFVDDDGIGTEQEEVRAGLDGEETRARNIDGTGAGETFDTCAHGDFELEDLGRGSVAGIDRLAIANHRQGQDSVVGVEDVLENIQSDPQCIGIEIAVAVDVLEGGEIVVRALGNFAENELVVFLANGEVATFFIGFRAAGDFHDEGGTGFSEPTQEAQIELGAKVVGVGDERVFDALIQEAIQPAGTEQGGVDVAVAGRAPFQFGVGGPGSWFQCIDQNFGYPVLHEFHFLRIVEPVGSVFGEVVEGIFTGGEGVHQQEAHGRAGDGAEVLDLLDDDVQEGVLSFDGKQALGFLQAHACAQASIELDADGLRDQRGIGWRCGRDDGIPALDLVRRGDGIFGDHAAAVGGQGVVAATECADGGGAQADAPHLFIKRGKVAHGNILHTECTAGKQDYLPRREGQEERRDAGDSIQES